MFINNYKTPKSSFLSMEKDTSLIVDKIIKNKRIQKLLYYQNEDPLSMPELTEDQVLELFQKSIKVVPKITIDKEILNYLYISFDNFVPSGNPEFRDNMIMFDIVCHYSQWNLKDFALRPYKIAGEIDSMLNNQKLTGIGLLQFMGATIITLTDEFIGVCLMYEATHGEEDKKFQPNPADEEQFLKDFKEMNS